MTVFDRSWYGRVLVERVEGFAEREQWRRAYEEIDDFERTLADEGAIIVKFWLHISPEEQLKRFEARAEDPLKSWKLTDEDWRNREKRAAVRGGGRGDAGAHRPPARPLAAWSRPSRSASPGSRRCALVNRGNRSGNAALRGRNRRPAP